MARIILRRRTADRWTWPRGRIDSEWRVWHYTGRWGLFQVAAKRGWGATLYSVAFEGDVIVWDERFTWLGDVTKVKKKTKAADVGDAKHLAAIETELLSSLMGIVSHCAITRYDDGDQRKPGWITIKTLGSAWQIEAKDPDTCCSLRVVNAKLDDALTLLDVLLESEEAPWEPDTWLQQAAAKLRKKS